MSVFTALTGLFDWWKSSEPGTQARRYLSSFARERAGDVPGAPYAWFVNGKGRTTAIDPALGGGRVVHSTEGRVERVESAAADGPPEDTVYRIRLETGGESFRPTGTSWNNMAVEEEVMTASETLEQALTALRPKLHRYCARMTGSVVDGEDVHGPVRVPGAARAAGDDHVSHATIPLAAAGRRNEDRGASSIRLFEVGRRYPEITINTSYSFGLDDQEFVVAFETDHPEDFLDLVMALRETRASEFTLRDTPIFTCIAGEPQAVLDVI